MRRLRRYRRIARAVFAVGFVAAGITHFVLGRTMPDGYVVYGDTALVPALSDLWTSFVMPHIRILTIALGAYQILAAVLVMRGGRACRLGTIMIMTFLAFITVLGYGWPTDSLLEDIGKNRIVTVLMAVAALPLLTAPVTGSDGRAALPRTGIA